MAKKKVAKKPAKLLKNAKKGKVDKVAKAKPRVKPAKATKAKPGKVVKPAKAKPVAAGNAVKVHKTKGFPHVVPTRKLEIPKSAGSGDTQKMLRELDKRIQQYERDILKARKAIEKLSQTIQKAAQVPEGKPESGPRRFRAGVVKIRDLQREMTDSSTQMRMAAARRQELLWVKLLVTGEMPPLGSPAAPSPQPPVSDLAEVKTPEPGPATPPEPPAESAG